jgi:hypothetical protein
MLNVDEGKEHKLIFLFFPSTKKAFIYGPQQGKDSVILYLCRAYFELVVPSRFESAGVGSG